MPSMIFTEKENGDLKYVAEIEDDVTDGEAVEALLEEMPRIRAERFVVLTGTLEDGVMSVVEEQEEVITTRSWKSSRNGAEAETAPKKRRGRPPKQQTVEVDEDDEQMEDEAPAPKRRGRPPGSKNKPKTGRPATKAASSRGRAAKPIASRKAAVRSGSILKRNPASDGE